MFNRNKTSKLIPFGLIALSLVLILIAIYIAVSTKGSFISSTALLMVKAQTLSAQHKYQEAADVYKTAWQEYVKKNDRPKAALAHALMYKASRTGMDYFYTASELDELLAKTFPTIATVERNAWVAQGKVASFNKNGQTYYDYSAVSNILFRNKALMHSYNEKKNPYGFMKEYQAIFTNQKGYVSTLNDPYTSVGSYEITEKVNIPRADLPKTGTLKIWMPMPIEKEDQRDIQVLALTPKANLTLQPDFKSDIGLAGFEFNLGDLKDDVDITAKFKFKHYEQNFKIDPAKVTAYDKSSDLYKQYTRSYGNTLITPEIAAKAKEIVGSETNPYLQAKKVYEYILDNVYYSFMPYITMSTLNTPVSVAVHKNGYGDCGAQSMYFSALMRSLGVPARTTGGQQMILNGIGGHFWAEFYVPNYGWVPVDTTVADGADDAVNISEKDKTTFKNYYFGNLDHYRYNIQKDVDLPLNPPWNDPPIVPPAIQQATADCDTCENDLNMEIADKYWSISLKNLGTTNTKK